MIRLFSFKASQNNLLILSLNERECRIHFREYPTYCVVDKDDLPANFSVEEVLNAYSTNEFETIQECLDYISSAY